MLHAEPILMLHKGSSAHSRITLLTVMITQTRLKLPLVAVTSPARPHPPQGDILT